MKHLLFLPCLLSLTVGCASGVPIQDEVDIIVPQEASEDIVVEPLEPEVEVCEHFFAAEGVLLSYVEEASVRWSQTTQCNITIDEVGIPFRLVTEPMFNSDGQRLAARTRVLDWGDDFPGDRFQVVEVLVDAAWLPDPDKVLFHVTHEMGHALAPSFGHTETGLMKNAADHEEDNIINLDVLIAMCSDLPCQGMVPEV